MPFLFQIGDIVRFYHKEMEAYMVAEGLFDDELTEDGEFTNTGELRYFELGNIEFMRYIA